MGKPLATVRGTMLTPGVSRNGRLYTRELIAKAVNRMQERLADPNGLPIVMRTHHDAGDNSALIVGRITDVSLDEDGNANYKAALYNTQPARDIAGLVVGDKPALKSVSIHGYWLSKPKTVAHDGQRVTTADDLEIDAVDFTASPGVNGAVVTQASYYADDATDESSTGRYAVTESMEAELHRVSETEAIGSKASLRKAIRAARDNADATTREHIIKRAKALGLANMIPSDWTSKKKTKESVEPTPVTEHWVTVCVGDTNGDMVKVRAENLHPDVIKQAIKKAGSLVGNIMGREAGALNAVDADDMVDDPNEIDFHVTTGIPSGEYEGEQIPDDSGPLTADSDEGQESVSVSVHIDGKQLAEQVLTKTSGAKPSETNTSARGVESEESVMSDETKEQAVEQAAPTTGLTEADITKLGSLIGESIKAAMLAMAEQQAASKAAAEESKNDTENSVAETAEQTKAAGDDVKESSVNVAELKETLAKELKAELRESILKESGLPSRKGFAHVAESDTDVTPTGDDLWDKRGEIWSQVLPLGASTVVPVATDSAES